MGDKTKYVDLINEKIGRLLVLKEVSRGRNGGSTWLCICDCGNEKLVTTQTLLSNHTTSCGCKLEEHRKNIGNISRKDNIYDMDGEYGICFTEDREEFFIFDKEDYNKIKDYYWSFTNNYFRCISINGVSVHRMIMEASNRWDIVDHINQNTKDNRKSNLRICTQSNNLMNRGLQKNNISGFVGVAFNKRRKRWRSRIKINGKEIHLGWFAEKEDAISARDVAEKKYFGEYANYQKQLLKEGECSYVR